MIPGLLDTISGAVKGLFGNDGISGLIDNVTTTKEEKLQAQAKLTEIQNAFQAQVQQAAIEHEKIALEREKAILGDMANARNREIEIATSDKAPLINKIIQPVIGIIIVVATLVIWALILFRNYEPKINEAMIIGSLTTMAGMVLSYYFGSSTGSKTKADQLDKIMNK